jgi:hypothetical protein
VRLRGAAGRNSRRFVRALGLPPVDSVRDLLPVVAERSGYPIHLMAAPDGTGQSLCGMWIRTDGADYVFVHPSTSRAHQDHIIAHELGHILRDHQHRGGEPVNPVTDRLAPTLDPKVVHLMLGRSDYEHRDEQEAELIGSWLQQHVHGSRQSPAAYDRVAWTLLRPRR